MERHERGLALLEMEDLAAQLADARPAPEQRLRGRRPETDDELRLDRGKLEHEPVLAGLHLAPVRLVVQPPLSLRPPFEMLDDVRQVHALVRDADLLEELAEEAPRRTDERPSLEILGVTRLIADDINSRLGPSPKTICVPSFHSSQRRHLPPPGESARATGSYVSSAAGRE